MIEKKEPEVEIIPPKSKKKKSNSKATKKSFFGASLIEKFKPGKKLANDAKKEKKSQDKKDELKSKGGKALQSMVRGIDGFYKYVAVREDIDQENPLMVARAPVLFGFWVLFVVFGIFGTWATFAPLDSAAIAQGSVILDSSKKTIQHLEGGIISEILVREGSVVEKDQPLIRLSETAARASRDLVHGQLLAFKAAEGRLIAERDGKDILEFDSSLDEFDDNPDKEKILDAQQQLFKSRKKAYSGKIDILNQRVAQFNDEIKGLSAQAESVRNQRKLIGEEIEVVNKLLEQRNAVRPRLLALQRKAEELDGNRGEYLARVAKAKQHITETKLEIIQIKNTLLNEVAAELRDTQAQIADLEERLRASSDVLERIVVVAPQSGIVNNLQYHTVGGVVSPGAPILDIIPQDDRLVIEAQVKPQDIDIVHEGLTARVRLTAFKTRRVPVLEGQVINVSADRLVDQNTGIAFYLARVVIEDDQFEQLEEEIELYPGMPADVMIQTGSSTFLRYLISPITDSFRKAFREQ